MTGVACNESVRVSRDAPLAAAASAPAVSPSAPTVSQGPTAAGFVPSQIPASRSCASVSPAARMPPRRPSQVPVGVTRGDGGDVPGQRSPVLDVVGKGGGQPLNPRVRADMESRLGADFSDVRIHTDAKAASSAAAVSAQAYTVGHEVVFGRGSFAPDSPEGRHRLAHELTHVRQQRKGPVPGTDTGTGVAVSDPSDPFEQEAEATANRVMSGPQPVAANRPSGGPPGGPPAQRAGSQSVQRCGGMPCDCATDEESSVQRSSADAPALQPVQRAMVCPAGVDPAEGTGCYEVPDPDLLGGNGSSQPANDNAGTQDLSQPANDNAGAQDLSEGAEEVSEVSEAAEAGGVGTGEAAGAGAAGAADVAGAGAAGAADVAGAGALGAADVAGTAAVGAVTEAGLATGALETAAAVGWVPGVGWVVGGALVLGVAGYLAYKYATSDDNTAPLPPVPPDVANLLATMQTPSAISPMATSPVMPQGLTAAQQELWIECNEQYNTYKDTQNEAAAYATKMDPIRQRIMQNQATLQDRIDLCTLLDELIALVQRLHSERLRYIQLNCDQFDWYNLGTTEAERIAAHQAELDNVDAQLRNLYNLRNRFCP